MHFAPLHWPPSPDSPTHFPILLSYPRSKSITLKINTPFFRYYSSKDTPSEAKLRDQLGRWFICLPTSFLPSVDEPSSWNFSELFFETRSSFHRRFVYILTKGSQDPRRRKRDAPSVRDLSFRWLARNPVSFRFPEGRRKLSLSLLLLRGGRRNIFRNGSYPELALSVPAFCPAKQNWTRDCTVFTLERFSNLRSYPREGKEGRDKSCLGKGGEFPRFFSWSFFEIGYRVFEMLEFLSIFYYFSSFLLFVPFKFRRYFYT